MLLNLERLTLYRGVQTAYPFVCLETVEESRRVGSVYLYAKFGDRHLVRNVETRVHRL